MKAPKHSIIARGMAIYNVRNDQERNAAVPVNHEQKQEMAAGCRYLVGHERESHVF